MAKVLLVLGDHLSTFVSAQSFQKRSVKIRGTMSVQKCKTEAVLNRTNVWVALTSKHYQIVLSRINADVFVLLLGSLDLHKEISCHWTGGEVIRLDTPNGGCMIYTRAKEALYLQPRTWCQ